MQLVFATKQVKRGSQTGVQVGKAVSLNNRIPPRGKPRKCERGQKALQSTLSELRC